MRPFPSSTIPASGFQGPAIWPKCDPVPARPTGGRAHQFGQLVFAVLFRDLFERQQVYAFIFQGKYQMPVSYFLC
jgi:hypothetical protein